MLSHPKRFPRSVMLAASLLGLSVLLTMATWVVLSRRIPIANYLPFWFWKPTIALRPDWWWIFPVLVTSVGAVLFIRKSRLPVWANLLALILVGFTVQQMFALIEGRGLDAMRDRMLRTGHARFAKAAVEQDSLLLVARRYDDLIKIRALPRYPHVTKPPGQLLVYMMTHRLARAIPWIDGDELQKTATFAAYAWPLLSYLCLVPLYLLSRLCIEGRKAYVPLLLYLSIPSVTLITLHLDQWLYPLLFATPICLAAYGLRSGRLWLFLVAGVVTGCAVFISFSLVVLLPFLALMLLLNVGGGLSSSRALPGKGRRALWDAGLKGCLYLAGIVLVEVVLARLLYYDVLESFRLSMSAHQAWKVERWTTWVALQVGAVDLLEFALWSGWALSLLALAYSARSVCRMRRWADPCVTTSAAFVVLVLSLAFFGKTVGETGRLWIFLTPLLALLAGKELTLLCRRRIWLGTATVVVLQILAVLAIKMWQDFA